MTDRRILKWTIPVDDHDHPIGSGPVVHVDCQTASHFVQVWTDEPDANDVTMRSARVYGTGQPLPTHDEHVGTAITGSLVWHVLARRVPRIVNHPAPPPRDMPPPLPDPVIPSS